MGCAVRICEAVSELKALGVGINLLPHSAKELIGLGLKDALEGTAVLTGSLRYHAKDGKTIWAEPRGMDAGYPCPQYSIHRGALQMLLLDAVRERLGADAILTSHEFQRLEQDDAGVTAVVYPVGYASNGRQIINWIAERRIERELPANKGDWNKPGEKSDFLPYFQDWRFDWLDIPGLFEQAQACWEFPMVDRNPLRRWTFGRVTLLGDAAHAMRPNGSNGASQGILDAVALAQCLETIDDVSRALDAYQSRRLEPTAALTLANRETGPEIVLRMVEQRCPDGFIDIHDHFTERELQEIADSYKQLAGFTRDQVAGQKPTQGMVSL